MVVRIGASWLAASFSSRAGTSSGPVALCGLRPLSSLAYNTRRVFDKGSVRKIGSVR